MPTQAQIPAEFRLPGPCVDLADQLGGQFGVPSYPLLACVTEAIGAVAGACLETDLWPEPVNGAFDLAIAVDDPEGMRLAIGHILDPILRFQGQKIGAGSGAGPKAERETLVTSSFLPQEEAELPTGPAASKPSNHVKTLVMKDPKPGRLAQVAKEMPEAVLLGYYSDSGFVELVERARSRAKADLIRLQSGWGSLSDVPLTLGLDEPLVQSQAGCLVLCRPPTLGRFLESRKELVRPLADRFLFMTADSSSSAWQAESPRFRQSLQAWRELVCRVDEVCKSADRPVVQLSLGALQPLREFLHEETRSDSSQPRRVWAQYAPLVAAKLALCFHFCVSGLKDQVSAKVMKEAIGMARWLVKTSTKVKAQLANAQQELTLRRNGQKMLKLIPEDGSVKWRKVSRRLHAQAKAFHKPTMEYLVATGHVLRYPDDSLQRLSSSKTT